MPSAEQAAQALVLVQAQAQARQQIGQATRAVFVAEVRAFAGWYDSAAIAGLAGRLAKLTRAAQKQTALSTDVFASRLMRLLTGRSVPARGPVDVSGGLRAGVPLESVYGRLADQWRWLEATRGESAPAALLERPIGPPLPRLAPAEVLDRVVLRGSLQLDDNLSLAMRDQWAKDIDEAPAKVVGFRRVLHPELAEGGSCGLCVAAATRLYSRADLLPMHSRCGCEVAPVVGEEGGSGDPGLVLNRADLKALYAAGGSTRAGDLAKTRYRVVTNSELGPRLVAAGHEHRTAADAARDDEVPASAS